MTKVMIVCAVTVATLGIIADVTPVIEGTTAPEGKREALSTGKAVKHMSPKKARRRAQIMAEGGLVMAPATGRVVRVVNAQTLISEGMFDDVVKSVNDQTRLPFVVTRPENADMTPMNIVKATFGMKQTGVVIAVVDDTDTPTLLLAPENGWVVLNVHKLAADEPLEGVLKARLTKEMWRAAAMVLGCYQSMQRECVTRVITSVKDLDAEPWLVASPEPFNKMHITAERLGIQMHRVCTYRRACEEGWAAPPKTDVQKKVWEQVKADKERGPTNPITIQPPNAKK